LLPPPGLPSLKSADAYTTQVLGRFPKALFCDVPSFCDIHKSYLFQLLKGAPQGLTPSASASASPTASASASASSSASTAPPTRSPSSSATASASASASTAPSTGSPTSSAS